MVESRSINEAPTEVPRFLVKISESLFVRATATQIFMIDMEVQQSRLERPKESPSKKEPQVRSDRAIKLSARAKILSQVEKTGGLKPSEANETMNRLNSNTTDREANLLPLGELGPHCGDEMLEGKELQNDSFNLSNNSPKSE